MSEYQKGESDQRFSEVCSILLIDETFPREHLLIDTYRSWEDYVAKTLGGTEEENVFLRGVYASLRAEPIDKTEIVWDSAQQASLRLDILRYLSGTKSENPRDRLVEQCSNDYSYFVSEIRSRARGPLSSELGSIKYYSNNDGMVFSVKYTDQEVKLSEEDNRYIRTLVNEELQEEVTDVILYDYYYWRLSKRFTAIQEHVIGQMLEYSNKHLTKTILTALFKGAKQSGGPMVLARQYQTYRGDECDVFGFELSDGSIQVIRPNRDGHKSYSLSTLKSHKMLTPEQFGKQGRSTIDRLRGLLADDLPSVKPDDLMNLELSEKREFVRNYFRITKDTAYLDWKDIYGDNWSWLLYILNLSGKSIYELR